MRQAGRCLPEYRAIRERHSFLEVCHSPELCAEVTVMPVRRLGVDAAVLFADIMLPLIAIGLELDIVENVGPVIAAPIRSPADVACIRPLELSDVGFVADDILCTLAQLEGDVPLIGFSGAPFTLASYLVEGKRSRDFRHTKQMMYSRPDLWTDLMQRLARIVSTYLRVQADTGVHTLQLFDSWVGVLSERDYVRYVQPYSRMIFESLSDLDVPIIHFGADAGALLEVMRDAGGSTIGIDWRVPLDVAWKRIGYHRGIQGNLDPLILLGPWEVVRREAGDIIERAAGRPGHIFNTGHGIHPNTDPDNLARLVDYVHLATLARSGEAAT
jgi:uroporphyrinogen decarboxylase